MEKLKTLISHRNLRDSLRINSRDYVTLLFNLLFPRELELTFKSGLAALYLLPFEFFFFGKGSGVGKWRFDFAHHYNDEKKRFF